MTRRINAEGLKLIKQWEGLKLSAYKDVAGVWTIGYGSTGAHVTPGLEISREEAERLLVKDLDRFERAVDRLVKVPLSANQFAALVSLAFNIGAGNFSKSTLVKKLNARDYRAAADQFTVWNKAAGKVMKGLVNRRADERALFLKVSSEPAAKPAPAVDWPPPYRNDGSYTTPPGFFARFWNAFKKRIAA